MSESFSSAIAQVSSTNTKKRKVPSGYLNTNDGMLKVGVAKYPQSLWISLYGFILATVTIVVVSGVFYYETKNFFQKIQQQELELEARYIEPVIRDTYQHLQDDLNFLSGTPPIQGIVKSLAQRDDENDKLWRARLGIIFTEMIKNYGIYQEISFVKLGKLQKTLVKVSKQGDEIQEIKMEELNDVMIPQESNPEQQIQTSLKRGIVNFQYENLISDEYSPENSGHKNALILTIPVFDSRSDQLFGAITLKAHFLSNEKLERLAILDKDIFFMDNIGRIFLSIKSGVSTTYNGTLIQDMFPQLNKLVSGNAEFTTVGFQNDNQRKNNGSIGLYHTVSVSSNGNTEFVHFFIKLNPTKLNKKLKTIQNKTIIMALLLMCLSVVAAFFIGRRLLKPLEQITEELVRYGNAGTVGELPLTAKNEIGVLARSFHNMLLQKKKNDLALLQQKNALDEHAIVSISDVSGKILYVNDKFTRVTGYSRQELIGKNHRIINSRHHPREFFTALFEQISNGLVWQGEICNRTKQGYLYWERATIVPFLNDKGQAEQYVSIRTEITENKKNAQAIIISRDILSKKVAELEEVNTELNQFAYIASHDLKSPLNGISEIVSWLEEDCQSILPAESKEHLRLLRSRSTRMAGLLNDLLEYSKVGRSNYSVETLYLESFVADIFSILGGREGFTCTAPNIPLILPKTPFEVVIRNLITNAIKHHDKAVGCISITADQDNEFYFIKVTDDGPGIAPEFQTKVLEMFQTLKSKDSLDGSGMGLAIVKKSIEHYGGTLSIESDGKRGTTMLIKWPQLP